MANGILKDDSQIIAFLKCPLRRGLGGCKRTNKIMKPNKTPNRIIPYNSKLKDLARKLRKNATVAERLLWQEIRGKKLGIEFHRQVPIDQYIVDFYCHELMLVIEIDGISHDSAEAVAKDKVRQERIEEFGVSFLRFYDRDVRENLSSVVRMIESWVCGRKDTSP